ncbi:MAG: hypothetical protein ABSG91_05615 [Syntrophobacteraceae bacterium]|jgi:hypothetical protein
MQKKRVEGLKFPSLNPIMGERKAAEEARINGILHPDTSRRFRYPSIGDPPPPEPTRAMLKTTSKLTMPSMKAAADRIAEQRFQEALAQWKRQMKEESKIMERVLR